MVFLCISNFGQQPWAKGYLLPFLLDSTIVAYSILFFISSQGRPESWSRSKMIDR
jgi:hypothetical protein